MELLFRQYPEVDAVFVANDQMALGVMQVIQEHGLRIPEDIGIVGFDDMAESAYFLPPLTTIHQDQHEIGQVAVGEIIKIIESGWKESAPILPNSIVLPTTLVVRQSSTRLESQIAKEVLLEKNEDKREALAG
jgi:DNA-binding LacI/PurR family transcriptional regulator